MNSIAKTTICEPAAGNPCEDDVTPACAPVARGRQEVNPFLPGMKTSVIQSIHNTITRSVDESPIPSWMKGLVKNSGILKMLEARTPVCVPPPCAPCPPPVQRECMPSEASAAKTIHDFQQKKLCGEILTLGQMGQMARTGYLTRKCGTTERVCEDVQDAAKRYMVNDAALFKKMECARKGEHDGRLGVSDYCAAIKDGTISDKGPRREMVTICAPNERALPSEAAAAKTINDFQYRELCGRPLTVAQMDQMANTGYLSRNDCSATLVSRDVRYAAKRFMANDARLFKKIDAAGECKSDGAIGAGDYYMALTGKRIDDADEGPASCVDRGSRRLPSEYQAARSVHDFQKARLRSRPLTALDMDQMARTGYLNKGGKTIVVPHDVQNGARRFMAGGGKLFKKMESGRNERSDGRLCVGDFNDALVKGRISPDDGDSDCYQRNNDYRAPSAFHAAKTINDFQKHRLDGGDLSIGEMDHIARTGYLQRDGGAMAVDADVHAAAQRHVANDCELFRKLDGESSGRLRSGDFPSSLKKAQIENDCGRSEVMCAPETRPLPCEYRASKDIHDYQCEKLNGAPVAIREMDEIARTGCHTRAGVPCRVDDHVHHAAKHFMANDAALFRKLDGAIDGQCHGRIATDNYRHALKNGKIRPDDGEALILSRRREQDLPSESVAARRMHDFQQNELGGDSVDVGEMDLMARTGYLVRGGNASLVSERERDAAKRFMEDGAHLFKKVDSATDGEFDGRIAVGDYDEAVRKGRVPPHRGDLHFAGGHSESFLPTRSSAAKTIHDLQMTELHGKSLNIGDMEQMARCGFLVKGGRTKWISPRDQLAAARYMANDAALFMQVESAGDGWHDGELSPADYHEAIRAGTIRPAS